MARRKRSKRRELGEQFLGFIVFDSGTREHVISNRSGLTPGTVLVGEMLMLPRRPGERKILIQDPAPSWVQDQLLTVQADQDHPVHQLVAGLKNCVYPVVHVHNYRVLQYALDLAGLLSFFLPTVYIDLGDATLDGVALENHPSCSAMLNSWLKHHPSSIWHGRDCELALNRLIGTELSPIEKEEDPSDRAYDKALDERAYQEAMGQLDIDEMFPPEYEAHRPPVDRRGEMNRRGFPDDEDDGKTENP